jgi:hypothetical protein
MRAIFGDAPPSLHEVELHEIVASWDGPSLAHHLDTAEFPASPPPKWAEFNTVQLTLQAFPVEMLTMSDVVPRIGTVDLDIRREPFPASETLRNEFIQYTGTGPITPPRTQSLIHLAVLVGSDPILKLKVQRLPLQRISAYLNEARPAPPAKGAQRLPRSGPRVGITIGPANPTLRMAGPSRSALDAHRRSRRR